MPIDRVLRYLKRGKETTQTHKLDIVLKDELAEAVERLQEFSKQVKEDLNYVEKVNGEHRIPDEMLKEEDE